MYSQTTMFSTEPGGGRRSWTRASAAATALTACAGAARGAGWAAGGAASTALPASAASKKAFWAVRRASARPSTPLGAAAGATWVGASGQTGGRIGAAAMTYANLGPEHG